MRSADRAQCSDQHIHSSSGTLFECLRGSGRRGREFKSPHPDRKTSSVTGHPVIRVSSLPLSVWEPPRWTREGLWHAHPRTGPFDLEGVGAGQVDCPGAIKEVRNAGLAGAAEDDVSALTTADAAVADGMPGARLDIVADHVLAMGADAVGSQFTDLGRDVLVLPLQPRGLPVSARRCGQRNPTSPLPARSSRRSQPWRSPRLPASSRCRCAAALSSRVPVSAPTTTTAAATPRMLRQRRRFPGGAGDCSSFTVLPPSAVRG